MIDFTIKAEIFVRLSGAALQPNDEPHKFEKVFRSVRIEYRDRTAIAVATNGPILACERLEFCGNDGAINITINPEMLRMAKAEAAQDGSIIVSQSPGWSIARFAATETMFPLNAEIDGEWPEWRQLFAKPSTKNDGVLAFNSINIARLGETAPTGLIVFPKTLRPAEPVIIRDAHDPSWSGVFLSQGVQVIDTPAQRPEWVIE